jgi:PST family polysaccharide transporter
VAFIVFPFAAACLALARPIVLVVLGPKWVGAIPLFSVFTLVAVSGPLSNVVTWLYESQGRGHDQLRNHSSAGGVTIIAYLLGLHWGPLGLVVSLAIISLVIRLPLVYFLAGRRGPVATADLWIGFLSHLPCWGVVLLATALAHLTVAHAAPIVQILVCAPIGLGAGTALSLILPRPRQTFFFAYRSIRAALTRPGGAQAS